MENKQIQVEILQLEGTLTEMKKWVRVALLGWWNKDLWKSVPPQYAMRTLGKKKKLSKSTFQNSGNHRKAFSHPKNIYSGKMVRSYHEQETLWYFKFWTPWPQICGSMENQQICNYVTRETAAWHLVGRQKDLELPNIPILKELSIFDPSSSSLKCSMLRHDFIYSHFESIFYKLAWPQASEKNKQTNKKHWAAIVYYCSFQMQGG